MRSRYDWYVFDPIGQSNPRGGQSRVRPRRSQRREQHLSNKVYVGNLPFSATESDLRSLFEAHGAIASVNVITDRETGRARGFAFVEMEEASDAANAIRALDGSEMEGRSLRVNEAQDKRGGGGGGPRRDRY